MAIDPAAFSTYWTYGSIMDPYGTGYEGEDNIGRVVCVYDNPTGAIRNGVGLHGRPPGGRLGQHQGRSGVPLRRLGHYRATVRGACGCPSFAACGAPPGSLVPSPPCAQGKRPHRSAGSLGVAGCRMSDW